MLIIHEAGVTRHSLNGRPCRGMRVCKSPHARCWCSQTVAEDKEVWLVSNLVPASNPEPRLCCNMENGALSREHHTCLTAAEGAKKAKNCGCGRRADCMSEPITTHNCLDSGVRILAYYVDRFTIHIPCMHVLTRV